MSPLRIPLLFPWLCAGFMIGAGCDNSTPYNSNSGGGAAGAVTVNYGGSLNYSPSSVTLTHGQAVRFNVPGHTVDLDDGTGTGTCMHNYTSFPVAVTFTNPGTYHFHCEVSGHASCGGTGTCPSSCTGMVGTVLVN